MTLDFKALRHVLGSAPLADTLDRLGYRHQVLQPFVRPLDADRVLFGPARTGRFVAVDEPDPEERPYELLIRLVDDLKAHEVAVLACDGPTDTIAPWGELLSTAAKTKGASGCLTDGLVRDARQIRAMGFAVHHGGHGPLDSAGRGRMVELDHAVNCAGVEVRPGDLVFGDVDGVVIIPAAVAAEVIAAALDKIAAESGTRAELEGGHALADVFARHGIL